jgi:hypothetical protein
MLAFTITAPVFAQTTLLGSVGLTGDENGSIGTFGTLDLDFASGNWVSGYLALNKPDAGFADSRSLSGGLDLGRAIGDWSVSAGAGAGDRDGFRSRQLRGNLVWQPGAWWLGGMVEHAWIDSTIDVRGLRTSIRVEHDFTVTGTGIRAGYNNGSGPTLSLSWMNYSEPSGSRFANASLLTERLVNSELQRLQADGRIDRLRLQNRLDQVPTGAYSNSTSVLSESYSLSVGYSGTSHQVGLDYYHDTTALFDSDLDSVSVRWMFPISASGSWLELWSGVSDSFGDQTLFAGVRILLSR